MKSTSKKPLSWIDYVLGICSFLVFLLAFYLSYFINEGVIVNLLAYAMPLYLCILGLFLCIAALRRKWQLAILIALLLCFLQKPISETWRIYIPASIELTPQNNTLNVLSYNVATFNKDRFNLSHPQTQDDSYLVGQFKKLLTNQKKNIDIICLQEFRYHDTEETDVIDYLSIQEGFKYYYMKPFTFDFQEGLFGMIIFSKYPIVRKDCIDFDEYGSFNKIMFVDILKDNDTIRIVNLHLHSMSIRWHQEDSVSVLSNVRDIYSRLATGIAIRNLQVKKVHNIIDSTQHPLLVCGDFNTFPYGSSYQKLKLKLFNTFEQAGDGFGFSLNRFPYFVRLDNQFFSDNFIAKKFSVYKEIDRSDHFPVIGEYLLKSNTNKNAHD